MNTDSIIIKNQLRNHFKPNFFNTLRKLIILRNCAYKGSGIVIDKNVKILRFPQNISIKKNVILKEGVRLCSTNEKSKLFIGEQTTIGYHTMIFATKNIIIGNNCMIAPFCYIIDSNHQTKKNILLNQQPMEAKDIVINDDVWLGTGVKVLSGVKINKGAIVAAGSVVKNNIPEYEIYGGIPAKKIGIRE